MVVVSAEKLRELIQEDGAEVDSDPWRHGQKAIYVVHMDGKPYLTDWIDVHHEDGIQIWSDDNKLCPAKQIEVTVKRWVEDV